MVSLPTQFIPVDDTAIAYDRFGAGPPVIFLHAGLGDRRMWDEQIGPLGEHFDVIRFDARGFGESNRTEAPYTAASDVLAILDELDIDKASLIGVSMGSQTAIEATVAWPERVSALVAVSARTGLPPSPALRAGWDEVNRLLETEGIDAANEYEMRMWFDGPNRSPNQVNQVARKRMAALNRELFERTDEFDSEQEFDPPAHKMLASINVPTLVVWGDSDVADVLQAGPVITLSIPGGRSIVMEDAGHVPQIEHPEAFNRLVTDFLLSVHKG
jgi:pimeloyl-ACP methyl ester carboxylesterase